ncbi:MAG: cytochrome c biogenesis protein CcsA, partial [Planctomycetota bacterium]
MAELGHFALILGLFLAGYAVLVDCAGPWQKEARLIKSGRNATMACWSCLTVASVALLTLLIRHDFRVSYVAEHTSMALPLMYRISAFWAGAAGSLLLWLWLQVGFVTMVFCRTGPGQRAFAAGARAAANVVGIFFLLVLILDRDPFALSAVTPSDGAGLNPLLQHPAMALHPPTLFVGYAAFAIPFAWALASLMPGGNAGATPFFRQARNWILWAWLFLTIGIALGAWWAYEELGWGGYWAWDPVENSSLMPWLVATALLHCSRTYHPRTSIATWMKVLSIVTFSLCIFGTFLTRYGLVSSVHAFPEPGLGILFLVLLVVIWIIAALLLW